MLVYRVENKFGGGAYENSILLDMLIVYPDNENQHIPPLQDKILRDKWRALEDQSDYYFGFNSVSQYLNWFDSKAGRTQATTGGTGYLKVYGVAKIFVRTGSKQVVFKKSCADLVETLPLNYYDL